jgi:hypothetical protein
VVPLEPGEPVVVGDCRLGVEVGSGRDDGTAARVVRVEVEPYERVDAVEVGERVVLAHRVQPAPSRHDDETSVPQPSRRGDRSRRLALLHDVDLL